MLHIPLTHYTKVSIAPHAKHYSTTSNWYLAWYFILNQKKY